MYYTINMLNARLNLSSPKSSVLLFSRLQLHGSFLNKVLSEQYDVTWVGDKYHFALTPLNVLPILFLELWEALSRSKKNKFSLVIVQYISLDALIALVFKYVYGTKLVLFALGSDILKLNTHSVIFALTRFFMQKSSIIFCASKIVANNVESWGFASKVKITPSIVSREDYRHFECQKSYDIVTIGNLDSNKNQMLLIEACEFLPNLKVLVIGDGHKRFSLELESKKRGIDIRFLGNIPHKQVFEELQKSYIYVHTSKSEGLPVAIMEAMFVGLPVVVVDSLYARSLVRHYGFKIEIAAKGCAQDLARKICNVNQNYQFELKYCTKNKQIVNSLICRTHNQIITDLENLQTETTINERF